MLKLQSRLFIAIAVISIHPSPHPLPEKRAKKRWRNGRKGWGGKEKGEKGGTKGRNIRNTIDLEHLSLLSLCVNKGTIAAEEFFDDLQPRRTSSPVD